MKKHIIHDKKMNCTTIGNSAVNSYVLAVFSELAYMDFTDQQIPLDIKAKIQMIGNQIKTGKGIEAQSLKYYFSKNKDVYDILCEYSDTSRINDIDTIAANWEISIQRPASCEYRTIFDRLYTRSKGKPIVSMFTVFLNHNTKEAVIAWRGTDFKHQPLQLFVHDFLFYPFGNLPEVEDALFAENAIRLLFSKKTPSNFEKFSDYKIYITGHSLGGLLALVTAAELCKNGLEPEGVEIFNGLGMKRLKDINYHKYMKSLKCLGDKGKIKSHGIKGDIICHLGEHFCPLHIYERNNSYSYSFPKSHDILNFLHS